MGACVLLRTPKTLKYAACVCARVQRTHARTHAQVKPRNPPIITPEDLANCGMSGTFFSLLSDVKQFFDYNYREVRARVCHKLPAHKLLAACQWLHECMMSPVWATGHRCSAPRAHCRTSCIKTRTAARRCCALRWRERQSSVAGAALHLPDVTHTRLCAGFRHMPCQLQLPTPTLGGWHALATSKCVPMHACACACVCRNTGARAMMCVLSCMRARACLAVPRYGPSGTPCGCLGLAS